MTVYNKVVTFQGTPVAILSNTTITNALTVSGLPDHATITKAVVALNIDHTYDADLDIFLIDPDGNRAELTTDNGGNGDNFFGTVFDDDATTPIAGLTNTSAPFNGVFKPEGTLSSLYDGLVNGDWTLEVTDDAGGDTGNLRSWSLILTIDDGNTIPTDIKVFIGDENANTLTGTTDSELFHGRRGNDIIMGNGGNDDETGGLGDDEFHFNFEIKPENLVMINDFTSGDDHLVLYETFLTGFKSKWFNGSDELKNKFFNLDKKPRDKNDIFTYKEKTGELFYDANGKKGGFDKDGLFATVVPHTHIEASDLMIHA
jgi:subtilisin-like proprotein convertase family protein